MRESLERHADAQAAVDVAYYVVVPYLPDQRVSLDWSQLLPARRRRLAGASLERSLESHRRVARESLHLTDWIRGDLEALDLSTHMLSGPEVLDLLWRRFNPTAADRTPERRPGARETRLEVLGALDTVADAREAARAALALRELVAGSAIDCADQRHLRVDRDLEQALYVATLPGRDRVRLAAGRDAGAAAVHALGARARAGSAARALTVQGAPPAAVRRQPRRRGARAHAGLRDARPGGGARRAAQGALRA